MDLTAWMEQWNMFPDAGGTVLCAVSGGRDSVCLLHYLHSISSRHGFSVAAAHFNHRLRPTADRDEQLVRTWCREREIPFYTESADVAAFARKEGLEGHARSVTIRFEEGESTR